MSGSGVDDGDGDGDALSPDVIFDVLMNARRRYVLHFLGQQSPIRLGELAELVAAAERGTTVDQLGSKERKSVYTSLYQSHLPKLAETGVIKYDRNRGTISLADRAAELEEYLDPHRGAERDWSRRYLLLAVASGALLLVHELLLSTMVSTLVVAVAIILVFSGLTGVYMYERRE